MRRRIRDGLKKQLEAELKLRFPEVRSLDPKTEGASGTFGFGLGRHASRCYFLSVVAREESDAFQTVVAWAPEDRYPATPFRDLSAALPQYLAAPEAEIALGQLSDFPYQVNLDAVAAVAEQKQQAIQSRIARGENMTPEEWLASLAPGKGSVESALEEAARRAEQIAELLREILARKS
jgi:hypothetical protein